MPWGTNSPCGSRGGQVRPSSPSASAGKTVAHRLHSIIPEILRTPVFTEWLRGLRDARAKARIALRIDRLALDNPGDVKSVGGGVSEMRIDYGPGYRVYFTRRSGVLVILLCGGDKKSQDRDIARAQALAASLREIDQ
jgi:putative addiction module killer protein